MSRSDTPAYQALGPYRRRRVDARLALIDLATNLFDRGSDGDNQ